MPRQLIRDERTPLRGWKPLQPLRRFERPRKGKKQGGSTESLSKILGHTSIKTALDEYGTEDLKEVQENYERMMGEMF